MQQHQTDSDLVIAIPEDWTDRDAPDCHRTTQAMAINPSPNDRVLFCPECGWNWPWGEDYGFLSAQTRFETHKMGEAPALGRKCQSLRAYTVKRSEMMALDLPHLDD